MKVAGIVAEFNPLHNGHAHLICTAKQMGAECVVATISGNFVQRGDVAIISKFARAKAAIYCGIDLCLELPVSYSMSTAQNFAFGSIFALTSAGIDTLVFGSESGDSYILEEIADVLLSDAFKSALDKQLSSGCTFAAARQAAVAQLIGQKKANLLQNPNDNLGIEYILAAKNMGIKLNYIAVKRIGAAHDSETPDSTCPSASYIRDNILSNNTDDLKYIMPAASYEIIKDEITHGRIGNITRLERAILSKLRSMDIEDFKRLPDISEGIENRIIKAICEATSLNELFELIKTKRYTHARIRRLILSAFIGLGNQFFLSPPPYVRILGHTANGRIQIKKGFKNVPAISRVNQIKDLNNKLADEMFRQECIASDLYELSLENPDKSGKEFREQIIVK